MEPPATDHSHQTLNNKNNNNNNDDDDNDYNNEVAEIKSFILDQEDLDDSGDETDDEDNADADVDDDDDDDDDDIYEDTGDDDDDDECGGNDAISTGLLNFASDTTGHRHMCIDNDTKAKLEMLLANAGIESITSDLFKDPHIMQALTSTYIKTLNEAVNATSQLSMTNDTDDPLLTHNLVDQLNNTNRSTTTTTSLSKKRKKYLKQKIDIDEILLNDLTNAHFGATTSMANDDDANMQCNANNIVNDDDDMLCVNEADELLGFDTNDILTKIMGQQQQEQQDDQQPQHSATSAANAKVANTHNSNKKLIVGKSLTELLEENADSVLGLACASGYIELVTVLLAINANVEDKGHKNETTPLMEACANGHKSIVDLLLKHGANVNAKSACGNTPMHYAVQHNHIQIVDALIVHGACIEEPNENGHTPLMEAASAGHIDCARLLIESGAGVNTHSNEFKETALTLACYKGHVDMVRFLLEHGADQEHKTDEMHTALMEACMDGHVDVAKLLLEHGAHVNMPPDSFESPLTLAACGGHVELANLLIEKGAELEERNDEGYTPLMESAREGHEEMVALLLFHDADINAITEETQETALTLAACGGCFEVAKFLIDAGADVNLGASSPLMEASQEGHIEIVQLLLKSNASVNQCTSSGETALSLACENGHTDVADLLVNAGADIDMPDPEKGFTPLMKAARSGHVCTVQYLLSKSANINQTTPLNEQTVLSLACSGGHLPLVELLLSNGADPCAILKDNSNCLIEAAKGGHTQIVQMLLEWPRNYQQYYMSTTTNDDNGDDDDDDNDHLVEQMNNNNEQANSLPEILNAEHFLNVDNSMIPFIPDDAFEQLKQVTTRLNVEANNYAQNEQTHASFVKKTDVQESNKQAIVKPEQQLSTTSGTTKSATTKPNGDQFKIQACSSGEFQHVDNPCVHNQQLDWWTHKPDAALENLVNMLHKLAFGENSERNDADCQVQQQQQNAKKPGVFVSNKSNVKERNNSLSTTCPLMVTPTPTTTTTTKEEQIKRKESLLNELQKIEKKLEEKAETQARINAINITTTTTTTTTTMATMASQLPQKQQQQQQQQQQKTVQKTVMNTELTNYQRICMINKYLITKCEDDLNKIKDSNSISNDPLRNKTRSNSEQPSRPIVDHDDLIDPSRTTPDDGQTRPNKDQDIFKQLSLLSTNTNKDQKMRGANKRTNKADEQFDVIHDATIIQKQQQQQQQQQIISNSLIEFKKFYSNNNNNSPQQKPTANDPTSAIDLATSNNSQQQIDDIIERQLNTFNENDFQLKTNTMPSANWIAPPPPPPPPVATALHYNNRPSTTTHPKTIDLENETESNHDTALTLACTGGHDDLVKLLIDKGSNLEHRDKKGFTPLILASTAGYVRIVQQLVANNADLEAQSERTKDTALSAACQSGKYDVVELLLKANANKEHRNISDYTPLSLAASGGYVNVIKLLLQYGAEINSRTGSKLGISPLMLAAMNGHTQAVKLLLDMGSDINAQIETNRNTALTLACFQGRADVVGLLLDRKANIEHRAKTGLTPLMEASSGGYEQVGRVLIEKGADVNAPPVPLSKDTALTIASDKGHYKFVQLLLENGASVDARNKKGYTPLWLACNGGHLDVCQALVIHGANTDMEDTRRISCLMTAFRKGHIKIVKYLVKHVRQFPSDTDCMRYIATITDKDSLKKCHQCMEIIIAAKDKQAQEANKAASNLLKEIDLEKNREITKKQAAARKREKRKLKKLQQQKEPGNEGAMVAAATPVAADDDDDDDDNDEDDNRTSLKSNDKAEKKKPVCPDVVPPSSSSSSAVVPGPVIDNKAIVMSVDEPKPVESSIVPPQQQQQPKQIETRQSLAALDDFEPIQKTSKPKVSAVGSKANESSRAKPNEQCAGGTATSRLAPPNNNTNSRKQGVDDEWKEVTGNNIKQKRIQIPIDKYQRVCGRGNCNIKAIHNVTGASLDIEEQVGKQQQQQQSKHTTERTIIIKGSNESTKHAMQLLMALINNSDTDLVNLLPNNNSKAVGSLLPTAVSLSSSLSLSTAAPSTPGCSTIGTEQRKLTPSRSQPKIVRTSVQTPSARQSPAKSSWTGTVPTTSQQSSTRPSNNNNNNTTVSWATTTATSLLTNSPLTENNNKNSNKVNGNNAGTTTQISNATPAYNPLFGSRLLLNESVDGTPSSNMDPKTTRQQTTSTTPLSSTSSATGIDLFAGVKRNFADVAKQSLATSTSCTSVTGLNLATNDASKAPGFKRNTSISPTTIGQAQQKADSLPTVITSQHQQQTVRILKTDYSRVNTTKTSMTQTIAKTSDDLTTTTSCSKPIEVESKPSKTSSSAVYKKPVSVVTPLGQHQQATTVTTTTTTIANQSASQSSNAITYDYSQLSNLGPITSHTLAQNLNLFQYSGLHNTTLPSPQSAFNGHQPSSMTAFYFQHPPQSPSQISHHLQHHQHPHSAPHPHSHHHPHPHQMNSMQMFLQSMNTSSATNGQTTSPYSDTDVQQSIDNLTTSSSAFDTIPISSAQQVHNNNNSQANRYMQQPIVQSQQQHQQRQILNSLQNASTHILASQVPKTLTAILQPKINANGEKLEETLNVSIDSNELFQTNGTNTWSFNLTSKSLTNANGTNNPYGMQPDKQVSYNDYKQANAADTTYPNKTKSLTSANISPMTQSATSSSTNTITPPVSANATPATTTNLNLNFNLSMNMNMNLNDIINNDKPIPPPIGHERHEKQSIYKQQQQQHSATPSASTTTSNLNLFNSQIGPDQFQNFDRFYNSTKLEMDYNQQQQQQQPQNFFLQQQMNHSAPLQLINQDFYKPVTLDDYQSIDSSIIAINPSATVNVSTISTLTTASTSQPPQQQRIPNLPPNLQFPLIDQWAAHNRYQLQQQQQQQYQQPPPILQHLAPQAFMLQPTSNLFHYHQHHQHQQQPSQQTTQSQHATNPNIHFNDVTKNMKKA